MKNKTIQLVGKHIKENDDEFEDGYVEVQLNVQDILDEIDSDDVIKYAKDVFDLVHPDDCLDNFTESELVEALEDLNYDWYEQYTEDGCIAYLEDRGYIVSDEEGKVGDYDSIDNSLLEDITSVFDSLNVFERRELRDLVLNFSAGTAFSAK